MKIQKKLVAGFGTSMLIGAALALLAGAAPASAHTPEVVATCDDLTVTLTNYSASASNSVDVTIDGKSVEGTTFGKEFLKVYALGDRTVEHSYTVVVDAPGTAYDITRTGASEPCAPPAVPAEANAVVHVVPPTCDVPARLVLGEIVNATWSTPTATSGPADYRVEATVVQGHTFKDGQKTLEFSGRLDGKLDSVEEGCEAPPVVVPEKPEPVVTTTPVEDQDCTSTTITTTTTTVTADWTLDKTSNTWVTAEPATVVTKTTRDATPTECPGVVTPPVSETPPVVETPPTVTTPPVVESTPVADALPSTGTDMGWTLPLAGGLLLSGVALMLVRRARRA